MDGGAIAMHNVLERMLLDDSAKPTDLTLSLLQAITKGFSDKLQIGRGGFAMVYKGMLANGTVAVKKLYEMLDIDEKQFNSEVKCLMGVKHKNIVRFLGYCSDTQQKYQEYNEKSVMADVRHRLLCFEYLPKGSLHGYITDASCGLEWKVRYQIIKGICEGLHYLHQKKIFHLDLKPANILLDDSMVPKIADFGLSRRFDEKQSGTITSKLIGSLGYLAPEFLNKRRISLKLDIYSLGVIIIEILTGEKGYSAVEEVVISWMNRLEVSEGDTLLEQVRVCTDIGNECMNSDPAKRPVTQHIIERLDKTGNLDWSVETVMNSSSAVQVGEVECSLFVQQAENASIEQHQRVPNVQGETSSEISSTLNVEWNYSKISRKIWNETKLPRTDTLANSRSVMVETAILLPFNITTMEITAIQETLRRFLEERKYLITILDDVWTLEVYTDLFRALTSNLKGSRIIITIRIADVAHLTFQDRMMTVKFLSEDESRKLFCSKAFSDYECPAKLRALRVIALHSSMPSTLLPSIAEKLRYMSVLELSGLPIEAVPDVIGYLFNLRHFGLRVSMVKLLLKPIEKLSNLLTLDLFPKLKSLSLRDMPDLKRIEIEQGAMVSLERLTLINLGSMTEVPPGIEFLMLPARSLLVTLEIKIFFETRGGRKT